MEAENVHKRLSIAAALKRHTTFTCQLITLLPIYNAYIATLLGIFNQGVYIIVIDHDDTSPE